MRLTKKHWLIAAALFVIVLSLGLLVSTPTVTGEYNDDGIYVATAKALATGKGYRLLNLPGQPLQTKYPFLYPAILAILWKISPAFPANVALFQLFSLCSWASGLALAFLYLVRFGYASELEAVGACTLFATAPSVLGFSSLTMSESLFSALLVWSVWTLDRALREARSRRDSFLDGLVLGLPALARAIAAPVIAASLFLLAWRRRERAAFTVSGVAVVLAPWLLWISTAAVRHSSPNPLEDYYTVTNYTSWWFQDGSSLMRVVLTNIFAILLESTEGALTIFFHHPVLAVVVGMVTWFAVIRSWSAEKGLVAVLLAYVALVIFWPWQPTRFLIPILPLLMAFLMRRIGALATVLPHPVGRLAVLLAFVSAISVNAVGLQEQIRIVRHTGYPMNGAGGHLVSWKWYDDVFRWIRANTSSHDVVASGFDSMVYLYTDRQAIRPYDIRPMSLFYNASSPPVGTVQDFVEVLSRTNAKYFAQVAMPGYAEEAALRRLVADTIKQKPGCLRERYRVGADERFAIYEVTASCRR